MQSNFSNSETPVPSAAVSAALSSGTKGEAKKTYGQILKSSMVIGGSSVISTGIAVIRTKAMALLLGPAGVGLMGMYNSVVDLSQSIAGMGVNSSGVRQIAEANSSGDSERIGRTVAVLRRTSIVLGVGGGILLAIFSVPVARLTFGNDEHATAIALLGLVVCFQQVSAGQGALIQGMRRIGDLARIRILGVLYGTLISIPLVYFLRERGIIPSLGVVAAMSILTSWWYARKVKISVPALTSRQVRQEAGGLLKLGFAFMASGFLTLGAGYVIRTVVFRTMGPEAAGFYQSAWNLGGMYVASILTAMGTDFYPRLTGVASDNAECNRLVNEQALVSILLAGPGVIATLTLAPEVIHIFYSDKFTAAIVILRWICLGMMLRVIAWPMGFIVLAKNEQKIFFWTEVAATIVHVGLAWLFVRQFGLAGAGMGFFGLYVWHGLLIYFIVRRLSGFRWSSANRKIGLLYLPLIALVFLGFYLLPFWAATSIGLVATVLSGIYSLRMLLKLVSSDRIPRPIRRLLSWFGLVPAPPVP